MIVSDSGPLDAETGFVLGLEEQETEVRIPYADSIFPGNGFSISGFVYCHKFVVKSKTKFCLLFCRSKNVASLILSSVKVSKRHDIFNILMQSTIGPRGKRDKCRPRKEGINSNQAV